MFDVCLNVWYTVRCNRGGCTGDCCIFIQICIIVILPFQSAIKKRTSAEANVLYYYYKCVCMRLCAKGARDCLLESYNEVLFNFFYNYVVFAKQPTESEEDVLFCLSLSYLLEFLSCQLAVFAERWALTKSYQLFRLLSVP